MKVHKYAIDEYGFEHWWFVCSNINYLQLEATGEWKKVTCKKCLKKKKVRPNCE